MEQLTIQLAVAVLIEALKEDEDYRRSWQANIAMAFKDEFDRQYEFDSSDPVSPDIHKIANDAASNFLTLLCHDKDKS